MITADRIFQSNMILTDDRAYGYLFCGQPYDVIPHDGGHTVRWNLPELTPQVYPFSKAVLYRGSNIVSVIRIIPTLLTDGAKVVTLHI
jgi:hypothetical protein